MLVCMARYVSASKTFGSGLFRLVFQEFKCCLPCQNLHKIMERCVFTPRCRLESMSCSLCFHHCPSSLPVGSLSDDECTVEAKMIWTAQGVLTDGYWDQCNSLKQKPVLLAVGEVAKQGQAVLSRLRPLQPLPLAIHKTEWEHDSNNRK